MLIPMTLGQALRLARGKLTQREVGQLLGVDQGTVSHWEKGKGQPELDQIAAIEEAAGRPRGFTLIAAGFVEMPKTTRETIAGDPALEPGYRNLVLSAYDSAVASSATDRSRTSATSPRVR